MSAGEHEQDLAGRPGGDRDRGLGLGSNAAGGPVGEDDSFDRLLEQLAGKGAEEQQVQGGPGGGPANAADKSAFRAFAPSATGTGPSISSGQAPGSLGGPLAFSAGVTGNAAPARTGVPMPPDSMDAAAQPGSDAAATLPPAAIASPAENPGEFTRIFTQLPKPRSAPPAILADVTSQPLAAAAPVVSTAPAAPRRQEPVSMGSAPAAPAAFTPASRVEIEPAGAPQPGRLEPAPVESGPTFMADAATPAVSPAELVAFSASPGSSGWFDETRIEPAPLPPAFTPAAAVRTPPAPPAIPAPAPPTPMPAEPAPPKREPGEFTQFFQALAPPLKQEPSTPTFPPPGLQPAAPRAQEPGKAQAVASSASASSPHTVEPEPTPQPHQPGAFTAFFQTPSAPQSAPDSGWSAAATTPDRPPSQPGTQPAPRNSAPASPSSFPAAFAEPVSRPGASGGFTELLHSLGNESAANLSSPLAPSVPQSASSNNAFAPAAPPAGPAPNQPPQNASSFAPQSFAQQSFAAPTASGPSGTAGPRPGEFTELMQTLQARPSESAPAAPAPAPFFEPGAGRVSAGGPSEFTRIIQSSAARSAQAPVAAFAPAPAAQPSAPAVGLPIAAPPKPALPEAAAKTTLQTLMPWLLAANGALLLLLIALAMIFLHHRH